MPGPVAISLFSGAGGLDLGAELAGFHVRAAVEINRDAVSTMEKGFPATIVISRDILQTTTEQVTLREFVIEAIAQAVREVAQPHTADG